MEQLVWQSHKGLCTAKCPVVRYLNEIGGDGILGMDKFLDNFYVPFEADSYYYQNRANLLFVGETGGEQEAAHKRPFYPLAVSGKILRQSIKDLKLSNYAIANVVSCRTVYKSGGKYRNRTPMENESNYCIHYLRNFIGSLASDVKVILLGKTAASSVLKNARFYTNDCYNTSGNLTVTPLVKKPPLKYGKKIYAVNFHPRYIASAGGIRSRRYKDWVKRTENILNA